ncbi:SDR family oxidoreductase [Pantoea sp. Bo_2]|uniref:SDR family oxidoreductase n=1 Tax=Candidatus Pantoea gossypiicola TaxID=2608008 RepID=A0AB34CIX8_9GAMM|nr:MULTISPECIES: SDR family oxidoreductase [Pantoea]KAA5930986.1 SDR family oxidoreductase [Pantoea sp. VH_8]KAA5935653.1 SDR family oxidoreductase [Pantoea sp. VH_4]KAA5948770.1 SDR family oxidoreductase [Pantoea sp. VH_3]KAA5955153.1 SDR family oxidoreductase [Pantoea sp. VH_25]KAA5957619.1 SDR family oxidoreductase [Pantoea sp. VH_24]
MAQQKEVLIIGASRGIGLAVVQAFAGEGWQVTATHRSGVPEQGNRPGIDWQALDMTDAAAVQQLAGQLSGKAFDAILINAGISGPSHQKVSQSDDQELAHLFLTNAIAPVRSAEILLPLLKPEGVLALTSSQLGSLNENPDAQMPIYSASKAALNMLSRTLTPAVEAQNGTLLTLHPGWVKTDMGGESAPLTAEESAAGIVRQLTQWRGRGGHHYVDYAGHQLQW